jgi:cellobiose phosphorylase
VENTSTTLLSPAIFERYCWRHLNDYGRLIREHGKHHVLHMCGHLKALLPRIGELPAVAIEAFTRPPVGNTTLADRARLVRAMDSVAELLDTPFGPKLCAPAFREIDPAVGLVTRCVPGKKENAAVFCHAAAWVILAECLLGRGGRAFAYYKKLLPDRVDPATFVAEPYVYSQYITSDEHPEAGRASHSWQTGTAAWMYRVAYDHILGVRPGYAGLVVDPAVPGSWKGFRVERVFRGTRYLVEVANPDGVESGVRSVEVDGAPIEGNVIAPRPAGSVCRVKVTMGKAR